VSGRRGGFGMFAAILRGALLVRRGRVALAVAAIAIGTSVAAALLFVSRDVGAKVSKELRAYGPNLMLVPRGGDAAAGARDLAQGGGTDAPILGANEAAWLATERRAGKLSTYATFRYGTARRDEHTFVLAATDLASLRALYPAWRVSEPAGGGRIDALVGERAATALGVRAGDAVAIDVVAGASARPLALRRVAIVSTGGGEDDAVFVDRGLYAAAIGESAAPFHLALARAEGTSADVQVLAATGGAGLGAAELRPIRRLSAADGEVLKRLRLLLVTVTAVALLAALICAMSTLADLVLERTKEIALLRALGARRRDVLALFGAEAVAMGLAGGLLGLGIGIVAAQAIGKGVFGTAIRIAPEVAPLVLALGVATALVASFLPVRYALAIEPAPVLRGE
jgi:putative ABC transport system permease protein